MDLLFYRCMMMEELSSLPELERSVVEQGDIGYTYSLDLLHFIHVCICLPMKSYFPYFPLTVL